MERTFDLSPLSPRRLTRPGISEMLSYWEGLRGGAQVPARGQIDPMALQPYLSHAAIAERTASGAVKLRLGGKTFERIMGIEPRGMPLRALFDVSARAEVTGLLQAVFDGPQVLTMTVIADRRDAPAVTGQMAVMPLRDMSDRITRAFVGFVADPFEAEMPLRFRVRNAHLAPAGGLVSADALKAPRRPTRVSVERGDRSFLTVIDGGLS